MLAINSSIDAPFMLLDEVDAHLDQENAEKY
jgi:chromosome segregation ATPase